MDPVMRPLRRGLTAELEAYLRSGRRLSEQHINLISQLDGVSSPVTAEPSQSYVDSNMHAGHHHYQQGGFSESSPINFTFSEISNEQIMFQSNLTTQPMDAQSSTQESPLDNDVHLGDLAPSSYLGHWNTNSASNFSSFHTAGRSVCLETASSISGHSFIHSPAGTSPCLLPVLARISTVSSPPGGSPYYDIPGTLPTNDEITRGKGQAADRAFCQLQSANNSFTDNPSPFGENMSYRDDTNKSQRWDGFVNDPFQDDLPRPTDISPFLSATVCLSKPDPNTGSESLNATSARVDTGRGPDVNSPDNIDPGLQNMNLNLSPQTSEPRSGKAPSSRRKPQERKVCVCGNNFRGEHELNRHIANKHTPRVKKFICQDPASTGIPSSVQPLKPLSSCKQCKEGKLYNAYYNAAAHLRRAHFNPKGKSTSAQGRGGKGGGDWPLMTDLKNVWFKEVRDLPGMSQQVSPNEMDVGQNDQSPDEEENDWNLNMSEDEDQDGPSSPLDEFASVTESAYPIPGLLARPSTFLMPNNTSADGGFSSGPTFNGFSPDVSSGLPN